MKFDAQHNDTQYSVVMLSVIYAECRKEAHYAQCHYAECRKEAHYAEGHYPQCHYAVCGGALRISGSGNPQVLLARWVGWQCNLCFEGLAREY
jgi:hypothetical protein